MAREQNMLESVNKAKAGDMRAFEELILAHEAIVYNIACQMINNSEDAKDISQEVFIKVFKNLKNFDGKSAFSTWIYRVAMNTCIDEMRKRKGKQELSIEARRETDEGAAELQLEAPDITPEESLLAKEDTKLLEDVLSKLSEEHAAILTLRDVQGFSYDEIADILSISIGTVKSRLARARTQFKKDFVSIREQNGNGLRLSKRKEETSHEL